MQELIDEALISSDSRICLVDDGSSDDTWSYIESLAFPGSLCVGLRLSRNCGHQRALLAGLLEARHYCDAAISMDCDGQDDVAAIRMMLQEYLSGSDIVYGVRKSRDHDSVFKRATAEGYYALLNHLGVETIFNHADYRLMSRRALDALAQFPEANLYLRGLVPLIGFDSAVVEYDRAPRAAGESHYPITKMARLAIDGLTSFSTAPLKAITGVGLLVSLLGICGVVWAVSMAMVGDTVAGWASMLCAVCALGGANLLSIGIVGTYIGKTYLEAKRRPRYFLRERCGQARPGSNRLGENGEW